MKKILLLLLFLTACSMKSEPSFISGTIALAPQFSSKVEPSDTVWIFAMTEGEMKSYLEQKSKKKFSYVAIQKITPAIFPIKYRITEEDVLFPEHQFKGNLFILVRIEKNRSNQGGTKTALEGFYKKQLAPVGSKNIDVMIDQE